MVAWLVVACVVLDALSLRLGGRVACDVASALVSPGSATVCSSRSSLGRNVCVRVEDVLGLCGPLWSACCKVRNSGGVCRRALALAVDASQSGRGRCALSAVEVSS